MESNFTTPYGRPNEGAWGCGLLKLPELYGIYPPVGYVEHGRRGENYLTIWDGSHYEIDPGPCPAAHRRGKFICRTKTAHLFHQWVTLIWETFDPCCRRAEH